MVNGEAVFDAPWQGRVFGMAHALAAAGVFEWDEFRDCLIEALAKWDREGEGPFEYYDHFQRALEALLSRRGLVPADALGARASALASRPHGHDHDHGHGHDDHDGHDDHHDHPPAHRGRPAR